MQPLTFLVALDCSEPGCKASGSWAITETRRLMLNSDQFKLQISNIPAVQDELCVNKVATSTIKTIKIFQTSVVHETNVLNVDLCTVTTESYEIIYDIYMK